MSKSDQEKRSALKVIKSMFLTSSVHGIRRLVASKETIWKIIWCICIATAWVLAIYSISTLVTRYLQYPSVEDTIIKHNTNLEFPAVTICNNHPTKELYERYKTNKDYIAWLKFLQKTDFGAQRSRLESFQGLYENLDFGTDHYGYGVLEDTILHCSFGGKVCSRNNFNRYLDVKNNLNCYTFNSGLHKQLTHITKTSSGPQDRLSLIISVDNGAPITETEGSMDSYKLEYSSTHSAGLKVQIHHTNTTSSPFLQGFEVPPGYSSSVSLKARTSYRLSAPYGICSNSDSEKLSNYDYSKFTCLGICKQKALILKCGCQSSEFQYIDEKVRFCGAVDNWREIIKDAGNDSTGKPSTEVQTLKCEKQILTDFDKNKNEVENCNCFEPCKETQYDKFLSFSYWPTDGYQKQLLEILYGDELNETHLHEPYKYFAESQQKLLEHLVKATRYNTSEVNEMSVAEKRQYASNLIRKTLLRLNIYFDDIRVVETRQRPRYILSDMLMDIGIILVVWLGVSVLTCIEFLELVCRLAKLLFPSKSKYDVNDLPERNPDSK